MHCLERNTHLYNVAIPLDSVWYVMSCSRCYNKNNFCFLIYLTEAINAVPIVGFLELDDNSLLSKMSLNLNPPEFVHFVAYIIALATKVLYLPI